MKKDNIFCLRMNTAVRKALKREAEKERRSMSSLLDKIIMDHLEKNDSLPEEEFTAERRRFSRTPVNLPATVTVASGSKQEHYPCVILELSLGGVLLTYPRGSKIQVISNGQLPSFELSFTLPETEDELHFHCRARHISENGSGLKVGAMFDEPAEEQLRRLEIYLT